MAPAGEAHMLADLQRQLAELMQQPVPGASRPSSRTSSQQTSRPASRVLHAEAAQPAPQSGAVADAPLLLHGSHSEQGSPRIQAVYAHEAQGSSDRTPTACIGTAAVAAAEEEARGSQAAALAEADGPERAQHQVCDGAL